MKYLRQYILLLLLTVTTSVLAAEPLLLEAQLIDVISRVPLVAASVSVNGKATMTNADGRFRMEVNSDDTLKLSCIGYISTTIPVQLVGNVIEMTPSLHTLPEVTVVPLSTIMKKLLHEQKRQMRKGKKLYANYMYRQTTMRSGKPISIVEAFFNGNSVGALRNAKLITGRYSEIDMKEGVFSHTANLFPLSQIQLYNPNKKLKRWDRILPLMENYNHYYNVKYDVIRDDGKSIYCIDFAPRDTTDETEIFVGKLYVDAERMSLMGVEGAIRNLHVWENYGNFKERLTTAAMYFSTSYDNSSGFNEVQSVNVTANYGNIQFSSLLYNAGNRNIKGGKKLKEVRDLRHQIDAVGKDNGFWEANEIVMRTRGERSLLNLGMASAYVPSTANDKIDSLGVQICNNPQIQEKIYLHTDNKCYYLGDTLWYKAYVMCADDLRPTDISRILYVELLTPDGYLVERQQLPIGGDGTANGQFALKDTLYSGYYEVRAYTRWQLNFNVEYRPYVSINRHLFYNKQFEKDFFREYPGLYSRVFPVYERPDSLGDYDDKRIIPRPKQSLYSEKLRLDVHFYPEGGELIEGLPCNVAFEAKDQDGQAVKIEGTVNDSITIKTDRTGRGTFIITPTGKTMKARFNWADKNYSFKLPESVENGCTMRYNVLNGKLYCNTKGTNIAAYSISCRGRVSHFERVYDSKGEYMLNIAAKSLPTGINEITVYDSTAAPLATRQIFVNNHDMGASLYTKITKVESDSTVTKTTTVNPYEALTVNVTDRNIQQSRLARFSISVRDTRSDGPTYDDGNMLTDILLSGDLKGFVPYPSYYFESNDTEHLLALNSLMLVQGWRRYKRAEKLRYSPEKKLTYEGRVLHTTSSMAVSQLDPSELDVDISSEEAKNNSDITNFLNERNESDLDEDPSYDDDQEENSTEEEKANLQEEISSGKLEEKTKKALKREVTVEAELIKDDKVASIELKPDENGHFAFVMPDYHDNAILFVNARQQRDSLKEGIFSSQNKHFAEDRPQRLFVKRDWFFPNFVSKYSWYQINEPETYEGLGNYYDPADSVATSTTLGNVYVRRFRKSRRAIKPNMPAIRTDMYKLYNDVTDCGLSYGVYSRIFPWQAATFYVGYLDIPTDIRVDALSSISTLYYHNYKIPKGTYTGNRYAIAHESDQARYDRLRFKRILNFKIFTDYDKRAGTRLGRGTTRADVVTMIENIPDGGVRRVYSSRRYVMPGYTWAEEFYSPNYAEAKPKKPTDYRRTLYWNPNATLDSNGNFTTTIYAGSRPCRIKATVCGMGSDGQIYINK